MQYIRKLRVKDLARIAEVEVEPPAPGLVTIAGKNAAGKTSLLKAIFATFGGQVPKPREQGLGSGDAAVQTDELDITLRVTQGGNLLTVRDKTGERLRSPKTMLKKIFGRRAFDVGAFLTSRDQVGDLLRVSTIPYSQEQLQQITDGLYDPQQDETAVEAVNRAHEAVYNERTLVNREGAKLKSKAQNLRQELPSEDVKPVLLDELYQLLGMAQNKENLQNQLERTRQQAQQFRAEIQRFQQLLTETENHERQLENQIKELAPYHRADIEAEIKKAEIINQQAQKYQEFTMVSDSLTDASKQSARLTEMLERIKEYKVRIMQGAKMPMVGLDIAKGQITYNGQPLANCSEAERILVSTSIAIAELPPDGLQAIFLFDPPQLDEGSWGLLDRFAGEKQVQIWACRVQESQEGATIYLEEGRQVDG